MSCQNSNCCNNSTCSVDTEDLEQKIWGYSARENLDDHLDKNLSSENIAKLKNRSKELVGDEQNLEDWSKRSAARAMMRAVGYQDEDFRKPLIAIAAPFTNITPCNGKILELATTIQDEIEKTGLKGYYFGTPVVTDGQAMGTKGMRYSLPSRDLIADCIEMMTESYAADGVITLCGCDKTIPGALMPIARNNLIGITLYGGSILPGNYKGKELNIVSTFEAIGAYSNKQIDYQEFMEIEKKACPGCGSCGGMYTANTMASAIEALGMSLPYSSSNPATNQFNKISEEKYKDCILTARAMTNLLQKNIRARDIMTKKAFENAITLVFALGGSTNAVQHFLALAKEAEVDLTIEEFNKIGEKVPLLADMKPSGRFVMYDLFKIGGVPMVLNHLLEMGLINGECLTVTGKTLSQNLQNAPKLKDYLKVVQKHQQSYLLEVKNAWIEELLK
jgi:dihydroxy-acid dehydratase